MHVLTAGLVVMPAFYEIVVAAVLPGHFYLGYAAASGGLIWLWEGRQRTKHVLSCLVAMAVSLACLYWIPWTSRKVFLTKFRRIEHGMSVGSVDTLLKGHEFTESLSPPARVRSYRHSRSGRFDSDFGIVRFQDGHVVGTEFLPD